MARQTEIRNLPCILTEAELRERGFALAQTVQNIATEEARQADLKAQMKATLTGLLARESLLANTVARREEFREVVVDLFPDHGLGKMFYIRQDTGEEVSSRPLTEDERQMPLL